MSKLYRCPVCNNETLEDLHEYDICTVCWWEDDPFQYEHPDYAGGANKLSLNQARAAWARGEIVL